MTNLLQRPALGEDSESRLREHARQAMTIYKRRLCEELGLDDELTYSAGFWAKVIVDEGDLDTDACRNRFEQLCMGWLQ